MTTNTPKEKKKGTVFPQLFFYFGFVTNLLIEMKRITIKKKEITANSYDIPLRVINLILPSFISVHIICNICATPKHVSFRFPFINTCLCVF